MWKRSEVCKGPPREGSVWTGQYFSFRNVWGKVGCEAQVPPVWANTCSVEMQEFTANELDAEIYERDTRRPTKIGYFGKF